MMMSQILGKKSIFLHYITTITMAMFFLYAVYFMIYPRALYRDYYGNYAGTAILVGLISLFFLIQHIYLKSKKLYVYAKYCYILICIWGAGMIIDYKSKLCIAALMLFFSLQIFFRIIIKQENLYKLRIVLYVANVILTLSSIMIHYFVNKNHEGLFSLAIHGNVFIFILVVTIINYIGFVIVNTMYKKQRGYAIYSAYLTLLFCLSFDTSIIKSMLCLFFLVLLIMEILPYDEHEISKEEIAVFSYKNRVIKGIICSFTIFLPYLILGPLEIYTGNQTELLFPYYHFFFPLLALSILISIIISFIIAKFRYFDMICASMAIFGFVSWFQAMFLNKILFDANGHAIEWGKYDQLKEQNAYIWILLIVLLHLLYVAICLKFNIKNSELWLAAPLVFIQMVAVVSLLLTTNPNREAPWIFEGSDEMKIGKSDNIIIFVLDAFGQTSLDEVINEDANFMDVFKDFTMYSDANSTYNGTFPSITYMFTAEHVPDEVDFDMNEYIDKACSSTFYNGFFDMVHRNGYKLSYYNYDTGLFGKYDNVENKFDNVASIISRVKYGRLMYLFIRMSAYRYLPYFVKPYLETETSEFLGGGVFYADKWQWPTADNEGFYNRLVNEGVSLSENDNEIKIYHLFGLHSPFKTDRDCKDVGNQTNLDTMYGLRKLLKEYFSELRKINKYNESTIIVMADHGGMLSDEDYFPIFLIKEKNQIQSNYNICEDSIDSKDFLPTILKLIGDEDYNNLGLSIFDNDENSSDRVFYKKLGDTEYIKYIYNGKNDNLLKQINSIKN